MKEKGYLQIYTGDGKVKTTAAFGLAVRALCAGKRVFIGQFVKDMKYNETGLEGLFEGQLVIRQLGQGCFLNHQPNEEDVRLAHEGLEICGTALASGEWDLVIMDELTIGYGNRNKGSKKIHSGLTFVLWPGELTCLLGPNGAGKSTLLRTLSAFQPPLDGELWLEGRPLADYSEREKSRRIGVVLTDKTQTGGLTVQELVALGRQPHTGFWGRLNREDYRLIGEAIEAVGITHKAGSYMAELSDGERQKVMIAKALVQECPLIIMDEPTAFLDVVSRIEIMTLLRMVAPQQQKTILLSTHDIDQALIQADRLWLLAPGTGLQCGITEDMVFNGSLDRLFGHDKICFDRLHGGFSPVIHGERRIVVNSDDLTLLHWTINLLNRYGYNCVPGSAHFGELPVITAIDPDCIIYNNDNKEIRLSSFEELMKVLR